MKSLFNKKIENEATDVNMPVDENSKQNEKKPLATWIISVIVFGALSFITGIGVLVMYLKPSILPSINPWNEVEVIESPVEEKQPESTVSEVVVESSEKNEKEEVSNAEVNSVDVEEDAVKADEETDLDTETIKPYVAGDDTKDNEIHTYLVIIGDYNWEEAYYDSRKYGDKAYLAHINSDEEYQYLSDLLTDHYSGYIFWIGARRDSDKYIYKWTNAKNELVGDNICNLPYWLSNEPSFYDVSVNEFEYNVDMFYSKTEGRYVMNDVPTNILEYVPSYLGKMGYILEIED